MRQFERDFLNAIQNEIDNGSLNNCDNGDNYTVVTFTENSVTLRAKRNQKVLGDFTLTLTKKRN